MGHLESWNVSMLAYDPKARDVHLEIFGGPQPVRTFQGIVNI